MIAYGYREVIFIKRSQLNGLILLYALIISIFLTVTYLTSSVTTVVARMIPAERDHTIVIDAGHGGEDGGATSCSGILESKYNLEIALKLEDMFHLLGYRTVMIRRTDKSVYTQGETIAEKKISDLRQRVKLVNETDDALLVSIHQNTFSDGRYSGAQVFYGPKGESSLLAEKVQSAFSEALNPESNRKAKKADGIFLMQHIECTGILVECGFISNEQEEAALRNPDYQKKICCVIAATVGSFLTK